MSFEIGLECCTFVPFGKYYSLYYLVITVDSVCACMHGKQGLYCLLLCCLRIFYSVDSLLSQIFSCISGAYPCHAIGKIMNFRHIKGLTVDDMPACLYSQFPAPG